MLFRPLIRALALLALCLPATAGEFREGPKAVLELFTSQGCSSCPKADAMLEELGQRPDVITLAYHVDFCYCYGDHRELRSFPTRRSSDLN